MIRLLVAAALSIMLLGCKKNDKPQFVVWQERTQVADRYLTRIDFTDSFGVVRTETEIHAEAGDMTSVAWHKYGDLLFDGIVKDKEGKVVAMMLNGQRNIHFKYDAEGRIVYKTVALGASPDTVQATSYSYDGQGRLQKIIDPVFATEIYYTGNSVNADSQVSRYVLSSSSPRYVDVYSYDSGDSPFNTLPDLVHYLDVNIRGSAGLSRHPIKTGTRYADGVKQSDIRYSCVYDAQGYLLMKVSNNKDTFRYYYNK